MLTKKGSLAWLASSPDPNNTGVCLPENFQILQQTISQVGHGMFCSGEDDKSPVVSSFQV
jgi:hypothetical protein